MWGGGGFKSKERKTYLCRDPQGGGGETEAGGGEEGRVGEVEGEEDGVPEEILRVGRTGGWVS